VEKDRLLISGKRAVADANGVHELLDRVLLYGTSGGRCCLLRRRDLQAPDDEYKKSDRG
jgi:hypothetical protein